MKESKVYNEAIAQAVKISNINYESFRNKTFLITGATGLLGRFLVYILDFVNKKYNLNISLVLLGRNKTKLIYEFNNLESINVDYVIQDINEPIKYKGDINYIIHMAASTASLEFVNNPVEVIETNFNGTFNLLKYAKEAMIDRFVYLSSMEVYGYHNLEDELLENSDLFLQTSNCRDSYPMSKAMSEIICNSYYSEYNIPITILRLGQTFGPGVPISDKRLFAYIGQCVLYHRPIILHTSGNTKRPYLYISDAIEAILMVLNDQRSLGQTFNVANKETYCSVLEFAEQASKLFNIPVKFQIDEKQRGYGCQVKYNLNMEKIQELGWQPKYNLNEMLKILVNFMVEKQGEDSKYE